MFCKNKKKSKISGKVYKSKFTEYLAVNYHCSEVQTTHKFNTVEF